MEWRSSTATGTSTYWRRYDTVPHPSIDTIMQMNRDYAKAMVSGAAEEKLVSAGGG